MITFDIFVIFDSRPVQVCPSSRQRAVCTLPRFCSFWSTVMHSRRWLLKKLNRQKQKILGIAKTDANGYEINLAEFYPCKFTIDVVPRGTT